MFTIDFHGEGITSCNKNETRKIIICVITGGRTSCEFTRVGTTTLPAYFCREAVMRFGLKGGAAVVTILEILELISQGGWRIFVVDVYGLQ